MSVKPTIRLSDVLARINNAKLAEDDEEKDKEQCEAGSGNSGSEEGSGDEEDEDGGTAAAESDGDAETDEDDDADDADADEDDGADGGSLGDKLADIAKEAAEKHEAALKKEAALFGQAFADSVLARLTEASEHQKMAELYDDTYAFAMQKLAEGLGAVPMGMPQQAPVDPNYGLVYPTAAAGPNMPGYVQPQMAQPPMPDPYQQQMAQQPMPEYLYPASLPAEGVDLYPASLPAEGVDLYPASLPAEPEPEAAPDPNIKAIAKAVSSSAEAAAEASRAAQLLTQAMSAQEASPEDEELAGYTQNAYNEAMAALQ